VVAVAGLKFTVDVPLFSSVVSLVQYKCVIVSLCVLRVCTLLDLLFHFHFLRFVLVPLRRFRRNDEISSTTKTDRLDSFSSLPFPDNGYCGVVQCSANLQELIADPLFFNYLYEIWYESCFSHPSFSDPGTANCQNG
jgi:hypothetical protein